MYFRFRNDPNYVAQHTTIMAILTLKIYPGDGDSFTAFLESI
jgi:hypothetical protein